MDIHSFIITRFLIMVNIFRRYIFLIICSKTNCNLINYIRKNKPNIGRMEMTYDRLNSKFNYIKSNLSGSK